ncbi:MAG TPA: amylo-alpha-1,6-glucosidase [Gemmatimonadales bacterium]|nr:amylo-alpha-1,6-glucosidase [Gemmatimonadales bacterium]
MTTVPINDQTEWLEADGLGGFASGTTSGVRTRRYHALLLAATTPPTGRMVLVNGLDAWIEPEKPGAGPAQEYLTRQRYRPGIVVPEQGATLESFTHEPWPTWTYRLSNGTRIEHEVFVPARSAFVALRWKVVDGPARLRLKVRPFLSGRDSHATHHENPAFRFGAEVDGDRVRWRPYEGVPEITAISNARYRTDPQWYRGFLYEEELARGLDAEEDLAAPGVFTWDLSLGAAVLLLGMGDALPEGSEPAAFVALLARREQARRARLGTALERAGDAYLVRRGDGKTIIAGYPWFTDWGRDTFIALRGLCLATGRMIDARSILQEWAEAVSEGMLPNRFADRGGAAEYNTIDASLWFVVAVHDYMAAMARRRLRVPAQERLVLEHAVRAILDGHIRGTRYRIRATEDGLLAGGEPGVQLTWMDAKVGDWVVTPRVGKPVEIQALWLNALRVAEWFTEEYRPLYQRGSAAFAERFWNAEGGYLHDVVDADHEPGKVDASLRPNQIFAVGGLPFQLLEGTRARQVVDAVERALWTPLGLRTLAPGSPGYQPVYAGDPRARDGAYHQGTVWPWLLGPFVEAWVRVRGSTVEARHEARRRFLEPLLAHLNEAGLGHISEIADAEAPHTPRGCPFQAWSVGEALRLQLEILRDGPAVVPNPRLAAIVT